MNAKRSIRRVVAFVLVIFFSASLFVFISAEVSRDRVKLVAAPDSTAPSAILIAELEGIRVVFVDTTGSGSLHVFKNVLELPLVISSSDNIIQMNYVDSEGKVFAYYVNKQKIVIRTDANHVGFPTATFVVDDDVDIDKATVDALDHQCTIYVDRAP